MENKIFRLDPFLANSGHEMDTYITTPVFQISELGVHIDSLLKWKEQGILNANRIDDSVRFNFVDFVWIQMIQQMTSLGVSLKNIEKVSREVNSRMNFKEELIEFQKNPPKDFESKEEQKATLKYILSVDPETINESSSISLLQYIITQILDQKEQVHIIVYSDGDCVFPWYEGHAYTYTTEELEKITYEPHVKISLTAIIRKFISLGKSPFDLPLQYRFSNSEYQLINNVHSGKYTEILVLFKNRTIESLQLTEQINPKEKFTTVMDKNDFMDLHVTKHEGKISKIERKRKVRF
jgi:DNA-binding transcriptional MerR regulator